MNQYKTADLDHDVVDLFTCLPELQSIPGSFEKALEFRNEYKEPAFHVPSYSETDSQAEDIL